MKQAAYCLFQTALGSCGIAWSEDGDSGGPPAVTWLQLPEATMELTESRIVRHSGAPRLIAPPPQIADAIEKVRNHLQGEVQDFRDIPIDLSGAAPFARQVYEASREIPAGETRTYGELARSLGRPAAARAVGQALAANPMPLIIPCHRILAAGGKSGGFSAHGGKATKARLLAIEGATLAAESRTR
jgi:O-6-methylguanine DNA methyltransferase